MSVFPPELQLDEPALGATWYSPYVDCQGFSHAYLMAESNVSYSIYVQWSLDAGRNTDYREITSGVINAQTVSVPIRARWLQIGLLPSATPQRMKLNVSLNANAPGLFALSNAGAGAKVYRATGHKVRSLTSDDGTLTINELIDEINLRVTPVAPNPSPFNAFYNGFPTNVADTTTIAGLPTTDKYYGGVLAPNGKIYGIPKTATSVLIIDPITNTIDTSITVPNGVDKWQGGVLAPNGKIYCIPYNSESVLIIDPTTNTIDLNTISGLSGVGKWTTAVLAPNGKIYGMPRNSNSVLIIDPLTNTVDTTTITVSSGDINWTGGVLAPNGKIYGIPTRSTNVLIIDPETNTADTTTIFVGLVGLSKWYGGVIAPNGKIYCIPFNSESVLIIDPITNTADTTTITGLTGEAKWIGGILAPNGKIYGMPRASTSVLIIDPVTNTVDTSTITGLEVLDIKWAGGVLAPNGKIYGMPRLSTSVLIIPTGFPDGPVDLDFCLSAFFNKF